MIFIWSEERFKSWPHSPYCWLQVQLCMLQSAAGWFVPTRPVQDQSPMQSCSIYPTCQGRSLRWRLI